LPGLRLSAAQVGRRYVRDFGARSGTLLRDPAGAGQAGLSRDKIVQGKAPSWPIERGMAGPGLLAHVLVSKYADHLPLYRQAEIFGREGVELDRATLADWVAGTSQLMEMEPLCEVLQQQAWARPRPDGCGRMCETIDQREIPHHRRYGSLTRRIARENIQNST